MNNVIKDGDQWSQLSMRGWIKNPAGRLRLYFTG